MPWKVILLVLARRQVLWPFNSVFGIESRIPSSSVSRRRVCPKLYYVAAVGCNGIVRQCALADNPSSGQAGTKDCHDRLNDLLERFLFQGANSVYHQITIRSEELSRTGIASHP
jgi:hypothetical protein